MNHGSQILDKEDRDRIYKEIVEPELQIRRKWLTFLKPRRVKFKKDHFKDYEKLRKGTTVQLNIHERTIFESLIKDFLNQYLQEICAFAMENNGMDIGTDKADDIARYVFAYNSIFIQTLKDELQSYFEEEREVNLSNNQKKKSGVRIVTETRIDIKSSEKEHEC